MNITAISISEAWFYSLYNLLEGYNEKGTGCVYRQDIDRGSFEKENFRLQYNFLTITITDPLKNMIPDVPPGISPPSTLDYVERYFCDYLLGGSPPKEHEVYTYASRIEENDQLQLAIKMLKETPKTNQAVIEIGRPGDIMLADPACLRCIDFKVVNDRLNLTSFWRSNDLWAAFPVNLAGLARLQEMVAEFIEMPVGTMHYSSSGAHIYDYQIPSIEAKVSRSFHITD